MLGRMVYKHLAPLEPEHHLVAALQLCALCVLWVKCFPPFSTTENTQNTENAQRKSQLMNH